MNEDGDGLDMRRIGRATAPTRVGLMRTGSHALD